MSKVVRPLSPHLSIYKPQITSTLSILHRITGVALYIGLGLLIFVLCVAAYAEGNFARFHELLATEIGQAILFGWTFAFYYHFFNGIRHLCWDIGQGFDIPTVNRTGWFTLFCAITSTVVCWYIAYQNLGLI